VNIKNKYKLYKDHI